MNSSSPIRQSRNSTATNSNQKNQNEQDDLDLKNKSLEKKELLYFLGRFKGIEGDQELPTTKKLAERLGVSIKTARKWRNCGGNTSRKERRKGS